jgi:hypothetical protein
MPLQMVEEEWHSYGVWLYQLISRHTANMAVFIYSGDNCGFMSELHALKHFLVEIILCYNGDSSLECNNTIAKAVNNFQLLLLCHISNSEYKEKHAAD